MVNIHDVLAHIGQVTVGKSELGTETAIAEYWPNFPYRLRLSITTDLEMTGLDYLNRYGKNDTVCFSLRDYSHGCQLAKELYKTILGAEPDMSPYTGSRFNQGDQLYLFVYVQKVQHEMAIC